MFSFAKKKTKTVLIIDIGSSSVGAGISLIPLDPQSPELPISVAFVRNTIPLKEHFDVVHFLETTLKYLDATLQSLQHKTSLKPDTVQCVISSPWFVSHARTISYEELTPFICTQKLFHSLVEQELQKIKKDTTGDELIVIEQQIAQCSLNGYVTQSPFDKKASHMTINLCVTQSSKACIERFNTLIRRFYGSVGISYTTTPFAIATVMQEQKIIKDSAMVIHVGEQLTDIGFIKNNSFLYQHSFPVGMYNLFHIMHESGVPRGQANTLLDGYQLGAIHNEKRLTVEESLRSFAKEWSSGFDTVLTNGFFGFSAPSECVILCDSRFAVFFQSTLSGHPLLRHNSNGQKLNCHFITPELFTNVVTSGPLNPKPDPVGLLVTVFSKLHHGTIL